MPLCLAPPLHRLPIPQSFFFYVLSPLSDFIYYYQLWPLSLSYSHSFLPDSVPQSTLFLVGLNGWNWNGKWLAEARQVPQSISLEFPPEGTDSFEMRNLTLLLRMRAKKSTTQINGICLPSILARQPKPWTTFHNVSMMLHHWGNDVVSYCRTGTILTCSFL